ncbi:DnaJ domain containing protein, partial [Entamoeba invadens IP1]
MALQSVKPIVMYWALRVTGVLLCSTADENIEKRGKLAVMTRGLPERIFGALVSNLKKGSPLVVHGCVNTFRYIVCEPYSNTTEFSMYKRMMSIISGLGRDVFLLFQSPCISVPHIAGQILRSLVEETDMDEKIKELQDYALLEGITLQYLQTACFAAPKSTTQFLQKHLAIHLLDVFTADHKDSEEMLERIIPKALLAYLDSTDEPPERIEIDEGERKDRLKSGGTGSVMNLGSISSFWKKWNGTRSVSEIRTRQKRMIKQKRNWGMFVFQLHQQHRSADLIWNHQTRQELEEALSSEIRNLKKDQEEGEVAWNHREFLVEYKSLDNEVCVDGCYIKCLLENADLKLSDPKDFFDTLYHRCLFETNRELQALAIQAMGVVYTKFSSDIGGFKDIIHIVSMLKATRSVLLRDRLIGLIRSLLKIEINARKFIDVGGIDLYVELVALVHLQSEHAVIPTQVNLLTNGLTVGEWFYGINFGNGKKEKKGPYTLDELKKLLNDKIITEDVIVWAQGMEDWKSLKDVTVLKWYLLKEDTGVLSPLELCHEIIGTLEDLVTMYPSRDMNGILLRPIPRAKRILSSPRYLPHVVQLLLTASPQLIDIAARLLKNLLEDNPTAQPKFYLTGAFYFALLYSGSNFKEISRLLAATHRQQRVGDSVELSVVRGMLPASLVTTLDRSSDEFAARFVGEVATPEIRWGSKMRSVLIDTISQHLGDFPSRLGINPLAVYSHVPIAPIVYEELKGELYCGKVYLKQLCNEDEYPDYFIADPVGLLQSILRTWVEMEDEPKKMSQEEAKKVLGVEDFEDKNKLRKAYFKLAQKYHPDRNPEGRDMFEKVNVAYTQLSEAGPEDNEEKIDLILHSQCILYEKCGEALSPYKYAGYALLVPCLQDSNRRSRALQLVYLTIRASTLNIQELSRLGGMQILLKLLDELCVSIVETKVTAIRYILRASAVASKYSQSLSEIKKSNTLFGNVKTCLGSEMLGVVEASLECVTCFSTDTEMRIEMFNKNYLGLLVKRILSFDPTLDASDQQSIHQMKNAIAGMSLLALKALVKIEENSEETKAVFSLFTFPLGMMMRTNPVGDVLTAITSTTQTPYLIWNNKTRGELSDYIDAHLSDTAEWSPKEYSGFRFLSLANELVIFGVYVRLFNEQIRVCEKLANPLAFLKSAIDRKDLTSEWLQEKVKAIANVLEQYQVATEFCEDEKMLEGLFEMMKEEPDDLIVQGFVFRSVKRLVSTTACVEIIAKSRVLPKFLILLHPATFLDQVIPLVQALFSVVTGLQQGILKGGLLYLLNHFVSGIDLEQRVLVAQLIGKMAATPSVGPKVTLSLGKFFPPSIVNAMKLDAKGAVVLLDSTAETPELIWNPEMKSDVGEFIRKMTQAFHSKQACDVSVKWSIPDGFSFGYKELENETCVGGVFIRVMNQNPSCPLTHPNLFTDGLFTKFAEYASENDEENTTVIAKTIALFFTNQPNNMEYVATSGHLSKVVEILKTKPSLNVFVILQVIVSNASCKEKLIEANAVPLVVICLGRLQKDTQIVATVFRALTTGMQCKGIMCYVPHLLDEMVQKAIFMVLDGNMDENLGNSAEEVKALVVDALQNALQDSTHGQQLNEVLMTQPSWEQYSTQKHGLFLSGTSAIAGYIAGPATSGAVGLLTAAEDASVKRPDLPPDF